MKKHISNSWLGGIIVVHSNKIVFYLDATPHQFYWLLPQVQQLLQLAMDTTTRVPWQMEAGFGVGVLQTLITASAVTG